MTRSPGRSPCSRIGALRASGTAALQLYGEPGESLIATARSLLARIDPQPITASSITATAFADAARAELESYRSSYPGFPVAVEVRDDVADLMVSFGRLLIPATAAFREDRVEPLIQHEVGTHVLTYRNGDSQPLKLLAVGLPSYEETQEGLAVLAEYVVGGLDPRRMRVLAARVVAASMMLANADFIEIFKHLTDDHGFAPRTAWSVTSRATYGGGSTKDIIYLRGIERVLGYFAEGRDIDPLLAGKLSLDHAPLVEDLIQQGVLEPPWARPRWLSAPGAEERLERVRQGMQRRRPTRDGRGRMRMAFLVNRVETEIDEYATTRLAKAAALMGHEVWYVGLGDLRIGEPDGEIGAHARPGMARDDDTLTAFVDRMKESSAERIRLDKLDAVFLRNDSIEDLQDRPWASSLGAVFGELLVAHGVTVVNDPTVLMRAATKVYLDEFPAEIRPRSLMTRNEEDVRNFISSVGRSIIKPLCGAKGRNVFMVDGEDEPNLNQIMEAVLEDGYIYAQGYVDGAEEGDMRIFLLDGELIEVDGHVSAFRRVPEGNDPRANISTGGRMQPGDITEEQRAMVEAMRDKLVQDGMFFVGIDVIGDKVIEINAESPGGLQAIERLYEVDICPVVIDALERRTRNGTGTPTANG